MMVKAHTKGADIFRSASTTAQDADFRAFATKTLAMMEQHKGHANDLATTVGVTPVPVKASFREAHREALGLNDTDTAPAKKDPSLLETCPVNYSRNPAPGGNQPSTQNSIQDNTREE